MADVGLIRKRIRAEIEAARRTAATRRERAADAQRAYEAFLTEVAVPVFRQVANILRAEGIPFDVQAPSGGVLLVSGRSRDAVELELDASVDPPRPMLVSTYTRGSRSVRNERPIAEHTPITRITEDDVIERLIEEIRPWLG